MKKRMLIPGMIFLLACSGCSTVTSTEMPATEAETAEESLHATSNAVTLTEGKYSDEKLDSTWDEKTATTIQLDENEISVKGAGAKVSESSDTLQKVTITEEGTYVVSGEIDNGQIIVNVENKGIVKLVLKDASITCQTSAPIYAQAGELIITLAEGTENTVSDGEEYDSVSETDGEPSAAIFGKDDLSFNGTGSLEVNGNYKNGIQSKDALKFVTGTYQITAVNHGCIGKDSVSVKNGNFSIVAGNDGIKATNIEESDKGYIIIDDGTFEIESGRDAMQAETLLLVNEGIFDIAAGSGSEEAAASNNPFPGDSRNVEVSTDDDTEDSAKGLKSYVDILIEGGAFNIDSYDDSIHSNNAITINQGSLVLTTGDDGIHADETLTINGGTIDVRQSHEGLEALTITINDGDIKVVASEDGINAAGGTNDVMENPNMQQEEGRRNKAMSVEMPEEKPEGMPKPNSGMNSNSGATLEINGGTIYVNASGDGLDANGSITMTGGAVEMQGPVSEGEGVFDYDDTFVVTGGTISGVGSSGMAQYPDESSTQPFVAGTWPAGLEKGAVITLKDQSGKELVSVTVEKSAQWYCFSSPDIKEGSTYTIDVDGNERELIVNGIVNKIQ